MSPKARKSIEEFHCAIDDTVVLLLQIRGRHGTSRKHRRLIDEAVSELQDCRQALNELGGSKDGVKRAFSTISKAIDLWHKLFGR